MTTSFTSLPIVDLVALSSDCASEDELRQLSARLHEVFATVGFAYLINAPLSFTNDGVFDMAKEFFHLPEEVKMGVAKKTFRKTNTNTYRGYFPAQPGADPQNLKAGFELGPSHRLPPSSRPSSSPFILTENNRFPPAAHFASCDRLETLYAELASLSGTLLALLASALGREPAAFASMMRNSVSTLRLLHYPGRTSTGAHDPQQEDGQEPLLSCTPHTDSGLLTLLHQDATGGLEVRNAAGAWVAAPHVPGSIVVNVGDLLARMSGGRLVATVHRVRAGADRAAERFSAPFFAEPGVEAVVDGGGMRYEEFVLEKMGAWVEFQDEMEEVESMSAVSASEDVRVC